MNLEQLTALGRAGYFEPIDIHFALLMKRLSGNDSPETALAAALVSRAAREGNVCLDLSEIAEQDLPGGEDMVSMVTCPSWDEWSAILGGSSVVGTPGEFRPLILDEYRRLYLYRYWEYEETVARFIKDRLDAVPEPIDEALLREGLERFFPDVEPGGMSRQRIAAYAAVTKRFCIITGGPGTGKTATVARILMLLLEQARSKPLRMALAAPTGKAAARLTEMIERARTTWGGDAAGQALPSGASTIHRLLGAVPHSPYFRHNEDNLLSVDVVVVDEASMVDLPLMAKLVKAVPRRSRLILLGDKDQLASVEAGSVLGDACDAGRRHGFSGEFGTEIERVMGCELPADDREAAGVGMQDYVIELRRSYRFHPGGGISRVSAAVNSGDEAGASELLREGGFDDIKWMGLPTPRRLSEVLAPYVVEGFGRYLETDDPAEAIRHFNEFRILCAVREGPYGVTHINSLAENILRDNGTVSPGRVWYHGRPVMITRNDCSLHLFNGDVGLAMSDPDSGGDIRVFFPGADGAARKFHPMRLPEHETVFATTVHKSQGSEFTKILLILPDRPSPVLTRELIYTGITRAREKVTVCTPEAVFRIAVERRIKRTSGLRDALWGVGTPFTLNRP